MACNDDACGPSQSRLSFAALQGQTYLLRIGTYGGTAGGVGTFVVQPPNIVQNPANGHFYSLTPGYTGRFSARFESGGWVHQGQRGYLATFSGQAEADWVRTTFAPDRVWFGRVQDIQDPGYSEPGGGWTWMTGEPVTYTQWNPGQPDNFGQPNWVAEFGELHADGGWDDVWVNDTNNNGYLTEWSAGVGKTFCDPMDPNSTGMSTILQGEMDATTPRGFRLQMSQGSPGQFGYFLVGIAYTDPGVMTGQGGLCLAIGGGSILGRYNIAGTQLNSLGRFDAAGQFQNLSGTSASGPGFDIPLRLPLSGLPTIQPGQEWFFQAWHREVDVQSNFSNGLG